MGFFVCTQFLPAYGGMFQFLNASSLYPLASSVIFPENCHAEDCCVFSDRLVSKDDLPIINGGDKKLLCLLKLDSTVEPGLQYLKY